MSTMDQHPCITACTQAATVYPSLVPRTAETMSSCQLLAPEETRDTMARVKPSRDIAQEHIVRRELARFPRVSEPLHVDLVLKLLCFLEKLRARRCSVNFLFQRVLVVHTNIAPRQSLVIQTPYQARKFGDGFGEAVRKQVSECAAAQTLTEPMTASKLTYHRHHGRTARQRAGIGRTRDECS